MMIAHLSADAGRTLVKNCDDIFLSLIVVSFHDKRRRRLFSGAKLLFQGNSAFTEELIRVIKKNTHG